MRDEDFLRAVLDVSILYVDMFEQSQLSDSKTGERKVKKLRFGFCTCADCENIKWIAHSNKKNQAILVSKKGFENELTNKANKGMGFFILIYTLMREYLRLLHPYSSDKTIQAKARKYFKKAMQIVAKDASKVLMNKPAA